MRLAEIEYHPELFLLSVGRGRRLEEHDGELDAPSGAIPPPPAGAVRLPQEAKNFPTWS